MNKISIGFTGTQQGMSVHQLATVFSILNEYKTVPDREIHHGQCIGADEQSHIFALCLRYKIVIHPPIKTTKEFSLKKIVMDKSLKQEIIILPRKDYLERDRNIVDACDLLIACPKNDKEELRSGTWATVRYARKKNKPIKLIFRDGTIH